MKPDILRELLEEAGFDPVSYSGRGMYGKKCIGIEVNSTENAMLDLGYSAANSSVTSERIAKPHVDNMGRDFIVYWPNVEWLSEWDKD